MSRLIVKNLPLSITDAKLRTSFSAHGAVTDLQLKYNKQGKFRGFAFIGYKEAGEADKAREWMNDTYIGAAKIKVELCKDLGAGDDLKRVKDAKSKPVAEDRVVESVIGKYKDDVKFQEFARAVTNGGEGLTLDSKPVIAETEDVEDESEEKEEGDVVSDLDYLKSKTVTKVKKSVELYTVKITGIPYKCKKKDIKLLFGSALKPKSVRVPPKIRGIAFAGFGTEKEQKQALIKNKSFIGQNQILVVKYVARTREGEAVEGVKAGKWSEQEAALAETETIGESGRIFVRNLSYSTTEEDIEELFVKFGPLTETSLPIDRLTRKQKGFAFVTFMMPEHAVAAFSALDGTSFQVREVCPMCD